MTSQKNYSDKNQTNKKLKIACIRMHIENERIQNGKLFPANCILIIIPLPLVGNDVGILMGKLNAQGPTLEIFLGE